MLKKDKKIQKQQKNREDCPQASAGRFAGIRKTEKNTVPLKPENRTGSVWIRTQAEPVGRYAVLFKISDRTAQSECTGI